MLEDKKYPRHSLIPSLYQVASYNMARKMNDIMIHEISNVYEKDGEHVVEKTFLAGLLTGNGTNNVWQHEGTKIDFYYTKGIVENLLEYLGLSRRYTIEVGTVPKELHPYQSAIITVDGEPLGYMGMIHPSISKVPIYVFELDLTKLYSISVRPIKNKEFSKYPSVLKDVAFALDEEILASDVMKTITKACGKLLHKIDVFDVYQGENVESGKKSLAFNLTFMDANRTLTDDEVMEVFHKMIEKVEKEHGAKLRDK